VTGIPNYPNGRFYDGFGIKKKRFEVHNGVQIYRSLIIPRGNSKIQLVLNYISFVIGGRFALARLKDKFDIIFVYQVSPMLQVLPAVWYSKKRSIPLISYITDLWPQTVEDIGGVKNKFILGLLQKISTYIYNNSSEVLVSSNGFIDPISKTTTTTNIKYLPIYAEEAYLTSKVGYDPPDIFTFIFAGNLGSAQGLDRLLDAVAKISLEKRNFKIHFIGDGREKSKLENYSIQKGLKETIYFFGSKTVLETINYAKNSSVGIVSLSDNEINKLTLPAKTQSLFAMSMPLLVIGRGAVAELVYEANCGLVADPSNLDDIKNNLIKFVTMSREDLSNFSVNALDFYNKNFSEAKFFELLTQSFINNSEE